MAPSHPPTAFERDPHDPGSSRASRPRNVSRTTSARPGGPPMGHQASYQASETLNWQAGSLAVPVQPDQFSLMADADIELYQLYEMFPGAFQPDTSLSLPFNDVVDPLDPHLSYNARNALFMGHQTPFGNSAGAMSSGVPHMGANDGPRNFLSSGTMQNDPYFALPSGGTDDLRAHFLDPYYGQDLSGSTSFSGHRTVNARQEIEFPIHGQRHEAVASTSTYLHPPTSSAGTRQTPESRSRPLTPTEQMTPHICVVSLFEESQKRRKGAPFYAADLPAFRGFCENVLRKRGYTNVPGLFSKPLKVMVGSEVSHTDRINHRHEQTKGNFDCPVVECPSQCTRKHNLSLHLGAHIGLTPHHCEGCDKFFASSSINRHRDTCAGLKGFRN